MSLRRVDNPPNPYLSEHRDWLEPPPEARLEVYEETARSILTENDSPDIPFRWSVNPYRGCQHACAYCYARPYHEYLGFGAGTDFDLKIVVKTNAAELLRDAFSRPSWSREWVCFSGITDCYQPLEAMYQLTRRCLEVCRDSGTPASLVTKGYLVVRDAELLALLHRTAGAHVFISVAFAEDELARQIEPQAPPPSRRFEAVRRLVQAGVPVSLMVAPIIPGLNDREIPAILLRGAQAGARSASYTALRLPANVAPVLLSRLRQAAPLKADRVEARIREMRGGAMNDSRFVHRMTADGNYWRSIQSLFDVSLRRYGMVDTPSLSQTTDGSPRIIGPKFPRRPNADGQLSLFG